MPLSSTDQERLAKLLAMFSSNHDGEVVNAARLAERLVKSRGETWDSVINAKPALRQEQQRRQEKPREQTKPPLKWRENAEACVEYAEHLSEWENQFLDSILENSGKFPLSVKQQQVLDRIFAKVSKIKEMDW